MTTNKTKLSQKKNKTKYSQDQGQEVEVFKYIYSPHISVEDNRKMNDEIGDFMERLELKAP